MTTYPPSINQVLFVQRRASQRVRTTCGDYAAYERRKSEWSASHPNATQAEYGAAMQRIARACAV